MDKLQWILDEIHTFSFKKMHLKMSSGKWWPFCLGLNVLDIMHVTLQISLFSAIVRCTMSTTGTWPFPMLTSWCRAIDPCPRWNVNMVGTTTRLSTGLRFLWMWVVLTHFLLNIYWNIFLETYKSISRSITWARMRFKPAVDRLFV